MKRLILLILTMAFTAGSLGAGPIDWQTKRTEHFVIYYAPGAESTAARAGQIAEEWRMEIARKLDFSPKTVIPMYLYPDRRTFADELGIHATDRVVGIAHTRTLRVRVDASGGMADIARVIPHELVHVFVSSRLKGHSPRLPLWMHEGLAKYLADDWSLQDAELLADAASGNELLPLERISTVFPTDDRGRAVAYVQSYSAVKYMVDKYSISCIPDMLSELATGLPFETALFYSIGQKPAEFEAEWRQYLWEEYSLSRWMKLIGGLISGSMGILAILAFRARIIHKRRKARELEEEKTRVDEWDSIMRGNPPA